MTYEPKVPSNAHDLLDDTPTPHEHPMLQLARRSQASFAAMIETQSLDIVSAVEEYRRRYRREPPPGFGRWFMYAREHGSLIMDEYDEIFNILEPFWDVSPQDLQRSVRTISADDPERLAFFKIENGVVTKNHSKWIQNGMLDILNPVHGSLPDMEWMASVVDEPLVLRSEATDDIDSEGRVPKELRHEATWQDIQAPCALKKPAAPEAPLWATSSAGIDKESFHGLPFVENKNDALDICQHPEFDEMHDFGRTKKKQTLSLYRGLVPMFSQAAPSTYSDIFFPTPQYWQKEKLREHDLVSWEDKKNTLYWRGSTTGGWALENSHWRTFIRHRLLAFVNGLSTQSTPFIQCYPTSICEEVKTAFHGGAPYASSRESFSHKYIMDVDGNTFANRFYRLLATDSAVLKTTAFKEWHDERLFPWVHYIPISLSYSELPEVMRFLTETDEGEALGRRVAEQGREWGSRLLRKVDATVFMYRLMLEYARS
ncbi:glycosyl transferase family 90-domain-containing protein [Delphinella strobiligena]|nr:glycosyl transferase family 90-domain-containing protein [Delphinella strobiligena]